MGRNLDVSENLKGICGLGLVQILSTKILKDEKLELAKE
jgi:hypothetical protein